MMNVLAARCLLGCNGSILEKLQPCYQTRGSRDESRSHRCNPKAPSLSCFASGKRGKRVSSRTIPFPDKAIAHAAGRLVIVARPNVEVKNPDLKKFIEDALPMMKNHLEKIKKFDQAKG